MFTIVVCKDTNEIAYSYSEYLQTKHWENFRERYIKTYGSVCECCGNQGEELHHLSYQNLGNEDFDDVIFLCGSCHKKEHNIVF